MQNFDEVNVDVLDAMGEVANMVLGNVKSNLEEELGPMGLSSPTVIYGRNYITHSTAKANWMVIPFLMGDRRITVRLCLTIGGGGRLTPVLAGALTVPV
jgi:chemotaxis protein CheX